MKLIDILITFIFTFIAFINNVYANFFTELFDNQLSLIELFLMLIAIFAIVLAPSQIRIKLAGIILGLVIVYIGCVVFEIAMRL